MTDLSDVYLFNPTCDFAIANGSKNWQPNKTLQKMETDLATLPMFFAKQNDYVLVEELPDKGFIESMKAAGFEVPHFVPKNELAKNNGILSQSINRLIPWGWSPAAHNLLDPLKDFCPAGFRNSPISVWTEDFREICSRKFASEILREILSATKLSWLIENSEIPLICESTAEIETALTNWEKLILKAPWSSSGRGLQPITKTPVHPKVWEKVNAVIREQGYIMAERLQNKVHDMAFLFEMKEKRVRFLGISHFFTNEKGQYAGNWLNGLPNHLTPDLADFIQKSIDEVVFPISQIIENSKMADFYEGSFGVDMLVFKDKQGSLRLNPCLEINVRHTMGTISLYLEKHLISGNKAIFNTYYKPGFSFHSFKSTMEQKHPLKIHNGKYLSGFLALTPSNEETQFGAYLLS